MTRFRLMNNGKAGDHRGGGMGIDMADGVKYRANTRGTVDVEDKAHARAIKRSPAAQHFDGIMQEVWCVGAGPEDRMCACGFCPWEWQHGDCPRCGADLDSAELQEVSA